MRSHLMLQLPRLWLLLFPRHSFSHLKLNELALLLTKHPISSPSSWSRLKEMNPSVLTLPYSFAMSCQKVLKVVLSDVINKSCLYSKSPPLFCLCYILLSLQPSHTCSLLLSCFLEGAAELTFSRHHSLWGPTLHAHLCMDWCSSLHPQGLSTCHPHSQCMDHVFTSRL